MRVTWLSACLAGTIAFAQTPVQTPPARDAHAVVGHSSIDGVVTATIDGRQSPLRRARVMVTSDIASQTTDTDTSGRFHVDQLPAGSYRISISKFGFVPAGGLAPLPLREGQGATVALMMQRGAAVEGQLLTSDGEPAVGLNVSAVRLGYGPYGKRPIAAQQTTTDDLGRYRIHTLPPGEYYLQAAPDPLRALNDRGPMGPAPRPMSTYYAGGAGPGTPRLDNARVVSVGVGQDMSGVDFTLSSGTYASLVTKVMLSSGIAPANFSIRIQRVGSPSGEVRCFLNPARSPNDVPTAQCPLVPPGDFWILVMAKPATPNAAPEFGISRLTMAGRDVQDLAITTAPGVPVTGRVEAADGAALPANLRVAALETDFEYPSGVADTPAVLPAPVAADGSFTFAGIPGPRLLRVMNLPADWVVASVAAGETDVSDTPTAFGAGAPATGIRVVVTQKTGAVNGVVLDANGQPKPGARVVIFPADNRQWHVRSRFVQTAEVGADGRYSIRGLLPGKYLAAVVERLEDGAWEDPDVLGRLQPTATPVTATAGATVTVDWRPR
jgi:hypothetical protein